MRANRLKERIAAGGLRFVLVPLVSLFADAGRAFLEEVRHER